MPGGEGVTFTVGAIPLIALGLVVLCLALWAFAEWAEKRYQRKEAWRRVKPQPPHIHRWIRSQEPVDGVYVEECICEAVRFVAAEGVA